MASLVKRAPHDSVEIHGVVVDASQPTVAWERLGGYVAERMPASTLHGGGEAAPAGSVRWVFMSDTCGLHHGMRPVPPGDVLVHCGDFSTTGHPGRVLDFVEWFAAHPHPHKVLVAGPHDVTLDGAFYDKHWDRFHPDRKDSDALRARLRADDRFRSPSAGVDVDVKMHPKDGRAERDFAPSSRSRVERSAGQPGRAAVRVRRNS